MSNNESIIINNWKCRQIITEIEIIKNINERSLEEGISYAIDSFFHIQNKFQQKLVTNLSLPFLKEILHNKIRNINIINNIYDIYSPEEYFLIKEDPLTLNYFQNIILQKKLLGTALFLFHKNVNIPYIYMQMQQMIYEYRNLYVLPIWQLNDSFYVIPLYNQLFI